MCMIPMSNSLIINKLRFPASGPLALLFLVSISQFAWAQSKGPRIKTELEIFDFGITPQYSEVSHVFWLRNTGDELLIIKDIITNCGCAEAPIEKKQVDPGDSTRVELIFGTANYERWVKKFAQILSNAEGRVPALTIRAYVIADSEDTGPIVAAPRAINLDQEQPGATESGEWISSIRLRNNGDSPIDLTTIDRPDRDVMIDGFDRTLGPGEEHEITLRFSADLPDQMFSRSVTFGVSDSTQARLTVPIFKKVRWGPTSLHGGATAKQGG